MFATSRFYIFGFLILFLHFFENNVVYANMLSPSKLLVTVNDINRDPWDSYKKITAYNRTSLINVQNEQLHYLLLKAQAEYLLYLYLPLQNTINEAQHLMVDTTSLETVSSFTFYAGLIAQNSGDYIEAIKLFERAMQQARQVNANRQYVYAKIELAHTKSLNESFETSLNDFQAVYLEAYALNDDSIIGLIYEGYGHIYGYMEQYEKSIEYYEKALSIYQKLGFKAQIADSIYGLATTYRYWGKFDLALDAFTQYETVLNYTPNQDIRFFYLYGLSMTLAESGDCLNAMPIIDQALKLDAEKDFYAELYKQKAYCLITVKRLDEASKVLSLAETLFDDMPELQGTKWQLEVIKIASKIAFAQGDAIKGYELLDDYYQKNTEVIIKNSSERLKKVRLTLVQEQKDIEAVSQQRFDEIQHLKVKQESVLTEYQFYLIFYTVLFVCIIIISIILQKKHNSEIVKLSIRDKLTNLYNRRYVLSILKTCLEDSLGDNNKLSIIVLNIDDLHVVNSLLGHSYGDKVLCKLTEITIKVLRDEDVIGYMGNGEFLCILPHMDAEQCLVIARRLLRAINKTLIDSIDDNEDSLTMKQRTAKNNISMITASLGISNSFESWQESEVLYGQATEALAYAKTKGKNCIVQYQDMRKK